jgi:hypothetical protein
MEYIYVYWIKWLRRNPATVAQFDGLGRPTGLTGKSARQLLPKPVLPWAPPAAISAVRLETKRTLKGETR